MNGSQEENRRPNGPGIGGFSEAFHSIAVSSSLRCSNRAIASGVREVLKETMGAFHNDEHDHSLYH